MMAALGQLACWRACNGAGEAWSGELAYSRRNDCFWLYSQIIYKDTEIKKEDCTKSKDRTG